MRIAPPFYPNGLTGAALLLLRTGISLACCIEMAGAVLPGHVQMLKPCLFLSTFLVIGFCTRPAAAIFAGLLAIEGTTELSASSFLLFGQAIECVALASLGPGAWSVDSRLFGRQVIKIYGQPW